MRRILILFCLMLLVNIVNAGTLDRFSIKRQYLFDDSDNYLFISQNDMFTSFTADYTITRGIKNYGAEHMNWRVTLVAMVTVLDEGSRFSYEIELTDPIILTDADALSQPYNDLEIKCNIGRFAPLNYVEIRLKCEALSYDEIDGSLVNTNRDTLYSSKSYIALDGFSPNPYRREDLKLFSAIGSYIYGNSYISGGYEQISSNWANVQGMASLDNFLYIAQAGNLHKLNSVTGVWTLLGPQGVWQGTEAVASSTNGYLYIVQNSRIHKVNPATGSYQVLGNPEWSGTQAMVAYGGYLFVVQNQHLHKVDENTGNYAVISGPDWGGTQAIASSADGYIYIIRNNYLHKLSTYDGSLTVLGGQNWANTAAKGMTFYNGFLYVIQGSQMYKVDKASGFRMALGINNHSQSSHLTAL